MKKLNMYKEINEKNDVVNDLKLFTLSRDPFVLKKVSKPAKRAPVKRVEKEVNQDTLLKFNVQGIIADGKKRLVIIEDITNRTTVFLAKGDKHESITILDVSDNVVKLKEGSEIREIRMN